MYKHSRRLAACTARAGPSPPRAFHQVRLQAPPALPGRHSCSNPAQTACTAADQAGRAALLHRRRCAVPAPRWYGRRRGTCCPLQPGPTAPAPAAAGDEKAWNEADWHWDPLAMTATAVAAPASAAACAAMCGAGPAAVGLAAADPGSHDGTTPSASSGYAAVDANGAAGGVTATTAPAGARARGKAGGGRPRKAVVAGPAVCQADGCGVDLSEHTFYHQRNK